MTTKYLIGTLTLLLLSSGALGQLDSGGRAPDPVQIPGGPVIEPNEGTDRAVWRTLDEKAAESRSTTRSYKAAQIVPEGWLADFEYTAELDSYLKTKLASALEEGKISYVYLYADWHEGCKEFRRTLRQKDYAGFFEASQMILIDYNFFRDRFDFKAHHLPMIIKVSSTGRIGPEFVYPRSKATDHPRKIYYKLKKFFG